MIKRFDWHFIVWFVRYNRVYYTIEIVFWVFKVLVVFEFIVRIGFGLVWFIQGDIVSWIYITLLEY